ncbi:glycosyltransferase, partial [Candidatus Woesearchaeota archaeon]|nr:glycosyltransferase [Candidatus Woesearchaeota archaeon]
MISIIIPAFNEEKYLPKLLDCIKIQTCKDYEVIVADADSKDTTKSIAKKYGCKVVKGGMPAVGRNNGAKMAKGSILLFLDADTIIEKDFIENALMDMEKRNIDVAGSCLYPLSSNLLDKIFLSVFNIWTFATQWFYPNACGSGIFCSKWLHKKIKGFDETIKLSEDMDYARRAGEYGKFRLIKNS